MVIIMPLYLEVISVQKGIQAGYKSLKRMTLNSSECYSSWL